MGRPERPVDPEAGAVQRLAHELRVLRSGAGSPAYRAMAQRAHFSAATLAQAAAGERLPSLAVVLAYARACGAADPAEWELRWKTAAEESAAEEAAARQASEEQPPYRGLVRFEPGDQGLFFGRERLVGELLELVHGHRLAVVFGASGSGKSSLLRAGLVPRLQQSIQELGCAAVLRVLAPGATPAATHGRLLAPGEGEPDSWVVVDQFEEIFTLCRDRAERARFIDMLLAAREPGSRLRVVIAVRADFYGRCAEHRGLVEALRKAHLLVGPMTPAELREAVVKPAAAAGLLVERELTARIVQEVVDQPGALPMLSHALLETWQRRRGRTLTMAAYEAAGGVHGAIAATAERVYGELSPAQALKAQQVLLRLIEPGQGAADTRRPARRLELEAWGDPEVPVVVERLARARLLTVDAQVVELAHESLVTGWPRLSDWIEEDREWLRHHRRLNEAALTWLELGRDADTLYRGPRLDRYEELFLRDGRENWLNATERAFLTAALDVRDSERRAAARTARRSRRLVTALSAALAVSLTVGAVAWQQHRNSTRDHTETAARRVAAVADSMRSTDPRTAMQLSAAAWRTAPLTETRSALLGALAQPQLDAFVVSPSGADSRRFLAASGHTLLGSDGDTWRTWDVASHRRTASGRLPADSTPLAVGPDARVLVLQAADGQRLWDTSTGKWTGPAKALSMSDLLGFGPSGRSYLLHAADSDRAQLRSTAGDRLLYEFPDSDADLAASADDRLVAVCSHGRSPAVWDLAAHRTVHGAWEGVHGICDDEYELLQFDAGDRLTAMTSTGVRAWDTASGRQLADIAYPDVQYASFSQDGRFLAATGHNEIRVWRLSAPEAPVFRHSLDGQHLYGGLAWDPGRPILRYLEGCTVHTLDLTTAVTSRWRGHALDNALLSPDGSTLATAERSGSHYRFQLLDTRDGRLLRELPAPPFPVSRDRSQPVVPAYTMSLMAFSPDGKALAYGVSTPGWDAVPQRIVLWNLTRDREQTSVDLASTSSTGPVIAVALGPGGRKLLAARTQSGIEMRNEVWDTAHRRRTAVIKNFDSNAMAVRSDGRLLIGNGNSALLPSGTVTGAGGGLSLGSEIGALAFSPDGAHMAFGDLTGRVELWDGNLRHLAGILPSVFPAPLDDTPEAVSAIAFSPDGRTLAVGGDAGTLQLWDTSTRRPLGGPLPTPGEGIRSLAFSSDSGTLYAAGNHVPLQRYSITAAHALTRVCARAGTTLSPARWRTYIPDAPYRDICPRTAE